MDEACRKNFPRATDRCTSSANRDFAMVSDKVVVKYA